MCGPVLSLVYISRSGDVQSRESVLRCYFFLFKQKTAYEVLRSLVGSEMFIRDRTGNRVQQIPITLSLNKPFSIIDNECGEMMITGDTVSYTHLTLPTIYSV